MKSLISIPAKFVAIILVGSAIVLAIGFMVGMPFNFI
jgi:hypothetical protein